MYNQRLEKLRTRMVANNVEQVIVADPQSIFYLTGNMTHANHRLYAMLVSANDFKIFVHEMFPIANVDPSQVYKWEDTIDPVGLLAEHIADNSKIAIDLEWPSRFLLKLMSIKPSNTYVAEPMVEKVRQIKSAEEIELMRVASKLNDKAIGQLFEEFDPEWTELDMVARLSEIFAELGTEGFSFDPIICFGAHAADPHAVPGDLKVSEGDVILIDIGCKKDLFCSDMTRTFFYTEPTEAHKTVYNTVLEAQEKAIAMVKPGVRFCDLDRAARGHITNAGFGEFFIHRLGHGIGMEVHEYGDVSDINEEVLEEGMIFSIEPGIYLEGDIGVRIEDLVVVTKDGVENLNKYPKHIQVKK